MAKSIAGLRPQLTGRESGHDSRAEGSVRQMCDRARVLVEGRPAYHGPVEDGLDVLDVLPGGGP